MGEIKSRRYGSKDRRDLGERMNYITGIHKRIQVKNNKERLCGRCS